MSASDALRESIAGQRERGLLVYQLGGWEIRHWPGREQPYAVWQRGSLVAFAATLNEALRPVKLRGGE